MDLERETENIKWFRKNDLRIKLKNQGKESEVWVTLNGFNLCFKLMMFDFVKHMKDAIMTDVTVKKKPDNQRVFIIDSNHALQLVYYIPIFIAEWNVRISPGTISDSDMITDEVWYDQL